jgi:hypothetical protein
VALTWRKRVAKIGVAEWSWTVKKGEKKLIKEHDAG